MSNIKTLNNNNDFNSCYYLDQHFCNNKQVINIGKFNKIGNQVVVANINPTNYGQMLYNSDLTMEGCYASGWRPIKDSSR